MLYKCVQTSLKVLRLPNDVFIALKKKFFEGFEPSDIINIFPELTRFSDVVKKFKVT